MNFSQMHERLRLELLRRIERGNLSVSLLARQTGYGQSHLSNVLRKQRQLSLEAIDRILLSQQMTATDLLPSSPKAEQSSMQGNGNVPVVSHAAALFEPMIRASSINSVLQLPASILRQARSRVAKGRRTWQRFVAVCVSAEDAAPMASLLFAEALVVLDRHYNSLFPYCHDHPNLYAVRHNGRLKLRYVGFDLNRVVLRPHGLGFPVELAEVEPGESPNDLIVGRAAMVMNVL